MKVEELSQYGKALVLPPEAIRKQNKVISRMIRREFGPIGMIGLISKVKKHSTRIRNKYPEAVAETIKVRMDVDKLMVMMAAMFFAMADRKGRRYAHEFMTRMIQNVSSVSMPAIYQLKELLDCEGEVFDNYKKFTRAMFADITRTGTWKNSGFTETEDLLEFKVSSCINVDFANAIGCPEIATLGCDHGLAGYQLIEEATNSEFRRPCTLAKGGDYCHFHFYRKGTAPDTIQLKQ